MPRKKLDPTFKKVSFHINIPREVKEMAIYMDINMSTFIEECIRKEYKKQVKQGKIKDNAPLRGQVNIDDI